MEERTEKRRRRRETRMGAFARAVTLLFAAVVVLLSLLGLLARDRDYSANENRSLARRPSITAEGLADGSFFGALSDYLADQFWGRDGWIALDTAGVRLLGRHDVNGVYLGGDGYLFGAPEEPEESRWDAKLAAVNDFARRHPELEIRFMLVPDAAAVMRDRLPDNAPVRDQREDVRAVEAALDGSIRILDAAGALTAHAGEDIYYRTDHHWTSLGAYYVFEASAGSFGASDQAVFDRLTVTDSFRGTLASKAGVRGTSDSIDVFLPRDPSWEYYVNYTETQTRVTSMFVSSALEDKDQYTVFFGGNHPLVEIRTTVNNGRNLLVLKDSYANSFMQFLIGYYDRIIMVDPRYYYGDLDTVLTTYGITDVLFLYSADTWMTDGTLTDVLATG